MASLWRLLILTALGVAAGACLRAESGAVLPEDGVVSWTVMRYEGPPGVEEVEPLLAGSVPHNGGVETQVNFVLEHGLGWQQAGLDFQQVEGANRGDVDIFIFVADSQTIPCGSHGQVAGCAWATYLDGRPVCAILAANQWRDSILINHEIGHCLGLGHSTEAGVMTIDYGRRRSWPTEEELATVRGSLD